MGTRGPAPKRTDQRRRSNTPAGPKPRKAAGQRAEMPAPSETWHVIARDWYLSLAASGQHVFYELSDWMTAYAVAESMSREFSPQPVVGKEGEVTMVTFPPKAASITAWLSASAQLLATEGARRRAAVELERPSEGESEEAAGVSSLDAWRSRTDGTG